MTLYENVTVSHEASSSESEGGGEAVEATLRVLAALKAVKNNMPLPSPPQSRPSHSEQSLGRSKASCKSIDNASCLSKGSKTSKLSHGEAVDSSRFSISSSSDPITNKSHYPEGVTPLQPSGNSPRLDSIALSHTRKSRGFFSCCFKADEQVIEAARSRESTAVKSRDNAVRKELRANERMGNDEEQPEEPETEKRGLTDYERAMIERLRELLSLDTSIPTLPTHIQISARASPVSLDITDSMIANTFSIDTRELQSVLQADQHQTGEMASRVESSYTKSSPVPRSHRSISLAKEEKSGRNIRGYSLPSHLSRKESWKNKKQESSQEINSTRSSTCVGPSQPAENGEFMQKAKRGSKEMSSATQSLDLNTSQEQQEAGKPVLYKTSSNSSSASSKSSHRSSRKQSSDASKQKVSNSKKESSSFGDDEMMPLKSRSEMMSAQSDSKSDSKTKANESLSQSGSSSRSNKRAHSSRLSIACSHSTSKHSSSRHSQRDSDSNPDKILPNSESDMIKQNETSLKRSTISHSASAPSQNLEAKSSLHYSQSMVSSNHSNIGRENCLGEVESREDANCRAGLPPRHSLVRRSKDPRKTIVAATSNRDEPEKHGEEGGFECICHLDDEVVDSLAIPTAQSEEVLHFGQLEQSKQIRRATSEVIRIGPVQPIRLMESRESSRVLGGSTLDNAYHDPTIEAASGMLQSKDIRDDISDLGMLSPKNLPVSEKENVGQANGESAVVTAEPRKMDLLDIFSGGLFCFRGEAAEQSCDY